MNHDVLRILQDLNFTEYEAKAYLALLEKSPLSGYAVSLNSGVPRSKIYEVLGGMADRGEVLVSHETPALYMPLPPDELVAGRKRKAEKSLKEAETALKQYPQAARNRENIWNITGHEAIINRIREAAARASCRILLEIWREDAEEIEAELRFAAANGVEITIVSYGEIDFEFAHVYPHDDSSAITEEFGGRWIILSVDDREVVAGTVSLGNDSRAAWTMHPGLVMPITEVIIHDLYIMEMLREHRGVLEASFGPNLAELRKRFNIGPSGLSVAEKLGLAGS